MYQPAPPITDNYMEKSCSSMYQPAPHHSYFYMYQAAVFGDIEFFKRSQQSLEQIVFGESADTILHVHIQKAFPPLPEFIEQILDISPSLLQVVNLNNDSPLHFITGHAYRESDKYLAIAELLIKRAKSVSGESAITKILMMKNRDGKTALDMAVELKNYAVLKIFIEGAEPSSLDFGDRFPDMIELTQAYRNPEMLDAVIEKSHDGITGLEAALMKKDSGGTQSKNVFLHLFLKSDYNFSTEVVEKILEICPISPLQADAEGNTLLHVAAERRYPAVVEFLLNRVRDQPQEEAESGERVNMMMLFNKKNSEGMTAIDLALKCRNDEMLKILIKEAEPCSLDFDACFLDIIYHTEAFRDQEQMDAVVAKSHSGITGLQQALIDNREFLHSFLQSHDASTEFVELILGICPISLLQVNAKGDTLLHVAARRGNSAVVEFLLNRVRDQPQEAAEGAERVDTMTLINMKNYKGKTAVHKAASNKNAEVLKILIKEAEPCSLDFDDYFPHIIYHTEAYRDREKMDAVVAKSHNGITGLQLALLNVGGPISDDTLFDNWVQNLEPQFVTKMLEICPISLLQQADYHGNTPLHIAAATGLPAIVEVILNRVNDQPQEAAKGGEEAYKTLLFNMKNSEGETAVDMALRCKNAGVLKILIKEAEPRSLDFDAYFLDIIKHAEACRDQEMMNEVLEKSHNGIIGLEEALLKDNTEGLLSEDTILGSWVRQKEPPAEFVTKMLEICPTSLLQHVDAEGNTILHIAIEDGHFTMVELLLNRVRYQPQEKAESLESANEKLFKMKNSKEETAVHKASRSENVEMLKELIKVAEPCSFDFGNYFPHVIYHTEAYRDPEKMDAVVLKSHNGITGLQDALTKDDTKGNFLHFFIEKWDMPTKFLEKMLEICPQLLQKVNAKGNSLLHIAAKCGRSDMVEVLLKNARDQSLEPENGERANEKILRLQNSKGKTALDKAIKNNEGIEVLNIIFREADPDYLAKNIHIMLAVAAVKGDYRMLDAVGAKIPDGLTASQLAFKSSLSPGIELDETVLHLNITKGNRSIKFMQKVLDKYPELLQQVDKEGNTPLHVAVKSDKPAIVEFLLRRARNQFQEPESRENYMKLLKMENKDGNTILDLAVKCDEMEMVKALIKEADPHDFLYCPDIFFKISNLAAEKGDVKMLVTVAKGPTGKSDLRKALKRSDILGMQPSKDTILHVHIKSSKKPSTDFVKKVLEICPSLLLKVNDKDDTPLHVASKCGHSDMVEVLLEIAKPQEQGSKQRDDWKMLKMENKEGNTPLHEAVRHGKIDVAKILINADDPKFPFCPNKACETPLYLAAARGYYDVVCEILEHGRSAAHQGPNKMTALHAAVINSKTPGPSGMTVSHSEVSNTPDDASLQIMREILEKKEFLTKAQDAYGWTPLHYAAYYGFYDKVSILLEFDKFAARIADKDHKMTALHMAASQGHKDIIEKIISECVECCEDLDDKSWNVLHFAMLSLSKKELEDLLTNPLVGSLINNKDNNENTPLHIRAAAYRDTFFYIGNSKAINKEKISVEDMLKHGSHKLEEEIQKLFEDVGNGQYSKGVIRDCDKKNDDCFKIRGERRKKYYAELKETKSSHLLVATLIATVTFTAAFTIPGGYNSEKGSDQGIAILNRDLAFRTFIITDTIAMTLSLSAVFVHFIMSFEKFQRQERLLTLALWLTILAMGIVVVAFVTGIYSVLSPSLWLAITTCSLGLSFFLLGLCALFLVYWRKFRNWLRPIWKRQGQVEAGCGNLLPIHFKKGH